MSRRSVSAWLLLLAAAVLLSAVGGCDASEGPARKLLQPGRGRDRGQAAVVQADGVLPSSSPSPSPVLEAGQLPTLPALTTLNIPPDTPTAEGGNADKLGQRRSERSNDAQPQAKGDKPEVGQPKVEAPSVEQPKAQQPKAEQPGRGRAGDMFDTDSLLKQSGRGQGQDNKGEKQQDKKDEKQQDKKEEKKVQEDTAKVELPAVVNPPMLNLPNVEPPAAAEGKKEDGPANNRNDQAAADNKPAQGDTASSDKKEEIPSDKKEEAAVGEAISQDQAADNKDRTTVETPDKQEVAPADEKEQDDKAEATPEVVTKKIDEALSTPGTASVESAATAIAKAGSKGRGSASVEAAASSIIRRFERGDGDDKQDAVAEAFAASAAHDAAATAVVFAKAAAGARRRGFERQFGRQCARGFVKARSRGSIETYTIAISKAIVDEDDDDVVQAYGVAFAEAVASGGEESDALAEATAIAFCKGGSTATAFAKAFDVALERDRNGCLVLTKVRALAVARCSNGFVRTYAEASVERKVLGFCGILEQFGIFDFGLDWDRLRRFGGHRR